MRKGPNDDKLQGGFEYSRLTRGKRFYKFKAGAGRYIKSHFWRRVRRAWRKRIEREVKQ